VHPHPCMGLGRGLRLRPPDGQRQGLGVARLRSIYDSTLEEIRELHTANRKRARAGIDPVEHKQTEVEKAKAEAAAVAMTLRKAATAYHALKQHGADSMLPRSCLPSICWRSTATTFGRRCRLDSAQGALEKQMACAPTGIRFNEHAKDIDGDTIFAQTCVSGATKPASTQRSTGSETACRFSNFESRRDCHIRRKADRAPW
jgi:hypothetical protein